MPLCRKCGAPFPNWLVIEGTPRKLASRRYRLECSPHGRHNTRKLEAVPAAPRLHKRCARCGLDKPIDQFYRRVDGQRSHAWCKVCNNDHRKGRFREDRLAALVQDRHGDLRCVCCGEHRIEFLGLDHVNNDGAEHRRQVGGGGRPFYAWLRKTGYTYEHLVVACHNCNMARAMYGQCPHRRDPVAQQDSAIAS